MGWIIAVLTSSDASSQGLRDDTSGQILRAAMTDGVGEVRYTAVLPDDRTMLENQMKTWIEQGVDLVVTTGGTGLGPRDVMPEATMGIADRVVPGIAEAMRAASLDYTPFAMLSRGIAAVCKQALIINFPGSPKAVSQLVPVVKPILPHALALLHGNTAHDA